MLNYEVRADLRGWLLSAGASGTLTTPDDSVAQPNGQLSPFSADTTRSDAVTFKRNFSTGQTAAFVGVEGGFGKRWKLLAGLRAESFAITGGYALDPRLSVGYRLNSRQSLHGSMNVSSQLPPIMDMISYASNRALQPIQVRQEALGMRLWQANWGTLDAEAYQKNYRREAVSTEYPALMLSNMVDTLGQGFVWLPLASAGTAQSRGLELAVARALAQPHAIRWSPPPAPKSTYRALDGVRRPGNYDMPMAANAMGSLRLPLGIQLDLRDSASSGRPTRRLIWTDSTAQNRGIYDMTRVNALRGPLYNRLDVEVERRIHTEKGDLEIQGGAENVLNRGNLLGYVWLDNCRQATGLRHTAPASRCSRPTRWAATRLSASATSFKIRRISICPRNKKSRHSLQDYLQTLRNYITENKKTQELERFDQALAKIWGTRHLRSAKTKDQSDSRFYLLAGRQREAYAEIRFRYEHRSGFWNAEDRCGHRNCWLVRFAQFLRFGQRRMRPAEGVPCA